MKHPEIVAALCQIFPELIPDQVDYWLEWMHYTNAGNMDSVFTKLLEIFTTTQDMELRLKIWQILQKPFRERKYVNKILLRWEATNDPLLDTIIPRRELWDLAGRLKPFFPNHTQYDIQTQLYDTFVHFSIPNFLPELLKIFLEHPDTDLHQMIFEFLKSETAGESEAGLSTTTLKLNPNKIDILAQTWEATGNPELYELLPKHAYWELCGKLKTYFPEQSQSRIQYNIGQLFTPYPPGSTTILPVLLKAYQSEPELRPALLKIFGELTHLNFKSLLCEYWLQHQDKAFEPFIERTPDWDLAKRLAGHLVNYHSLYFIQYHLQKGRQKQPEHGFIPDLLNFALQTTDSSFSTEILHYITEIGQTYHISERWEKTQHPALEAWLPRDVRWEMAGKIREIYPTLGQYGIYIWLETIKTQSEPGIMKNHLRIVTGNADSELQEYLLSVFDQLQNERNIVEICRVWADTRHPALELLINKHGWTVPEEMIAGILTISQKLVIGLKTLNTGILDNLKVNELRTLIDLTEDSDLQIAQRAAVILRQQTLLDLPWLAKLWKESRQSVVLELLVERNFLPATPAETRLAVALHLNKLEGVVFDKPELVPLLVEIAEGTVADPAQLAQELLRKLKKPASQQALCRVIIEREAPHSQQIALEQGFIPADTGDKALFYFISGQFDSYDTLDFDGRFLRASYQAGDATFKKRLTGIIRAAGRLEYLTSLTTKNNPGQVNAEEAELLIELLESRSDWPGLWSKVFELPIQWSVEALRRLKVVGWQPALDYEQELLTELATLEPVVSKAFQNPAAFFAQLPLALLRAQAKVSAKVTDVAFSPTRPLLAIATADKKVALWNLQEGRLEQTLKDFDMVINRLIFTHGGTLICAERSPTKPCKLYAWDGTELHTIGLHPGTINVLAVVSDSQVLAACRSHQLAIWDILARPTDSELRQNYNFVSMPDWPRNGVISPDRGLFAALTSKILYYSVPMLEKIDESNAGKAPLAEFAPDNQALVVGRSDGKLRIYERNGKGAFKANPSLLDNPNLQQSRTVGLAALPAQNLFLTATENGNVEFFEWANRSSIGRLKVSEQRLTVLKLSPSGDFMAAGDWEAGFSLWDLRPSQLQMFLEQPLAQGRLGNLAMLEILSENTSGLSAEVRASCRYAWLVLHHRYRFAVELADAPTILAGEFDIEI